MGLSCRYRSASRDGCFVIHPVHTGLLHYGWQGRTVPRQGIVHQVVRRGRRPGWMPGVRDRIQVGVERRDSQGRVHLVVTPYRQRLH